MQSWCLQASRWDPWADAGVGSINSVTSITEIKLEENIRRKDFTPYELSKEMVRQGEQLAPIISGRLPEKDARGRKAEREAPKADIAAALGTSERSYHRAEQHVEAAAKYPELAAPGSTESVYHDGTDSIHHDATT